MEKNGGRYKEGREGKKLVGETKREREMKKVVSF